MINNEIWKEIPGYNGMYMVSNTGKVKSLKYIQNILIGEKMLEPLEDKRKGLFRVGLCKRSKRRYFSISHLVAKAFIDNPQNLKCVAHIDGDTRNNSVENLKWSSYWDARQSLKVNKK